MKTHDKIRERLEACNNALEYAAFNYDGRIIEDLEPGIIESTGVSDTCLIEVRNNREFATEIEQLFAGCYRKVNGDIGDIFEVQYWAGYFYDRKDNYEIAEKIIENLKSSIEPLTDQPDSQPEPIETEEKICMENGCKSIATIDYNGHGYWVCDKHYISLNNEFDEEYR
jgi:hypothetical protein